MDNELVSIIIRTCGRPEVLRNALESVRGQTYPNIEAVVVEDGPGTCGDLVRQNFHDLNCKYRALGTHCGRSRAGNAGMSMASGKYLNFLDEDDVLLKNHVQVLVGRLEGSPYSVAYAVAEERQIRVKGYSPYAFKVRRKLIRYRYPFNRLLLCHMNLFPIQSVMFERNLFEQYGGFDEGLDLLEDWDLWLRYAMNRDFLFVDEVTSAYHTPFRGRQRKERGARLIEARREVREKSREYLMRLDAAQAGEDVDYIAGVFNKRSIIIYLRKIQSHLLYGDTR